MSLKRLFGLACLAFLSVGVVACSGPSPSPAPTSKGDSDAILIVKVDPLREGLAAAMAHQGPKRGVRKLLPSQESGDGMSWTATAQRSPVLFKPRPSKCSNCALLESTIEVQFGRFTAPLLAGSQTELVGRGSMLARLPVVLSASRSMDKPGWWDLQMRASPEDPLEVQWVHQLPSTDSPQLDDRLRDLGQAAVEAETLLRVQRSPLMQFRAWQTKDPKLRADVVTLTVRRRDLVVGLRAKAPLGRSLSSGSADVLGQHFSLKASRALVEALGTEDALKRFVLADARGRRGEFVSSQGTDETRVYGGHFTNPTESKRSPSKPERAKKRLKPHQTLP